jgi:putative methionine-R-sulfoxide reductase with GAF domain
VHWQGRIVGQIDIDSDARAAFSEEDLASLRSAAELIAPLFVGA